MGEGKPAPARSKILFQPHFIGQGMAGMLQQAERQKFFGSFFQKRTFLLLVQCLGWV
jgi:hypothetical protein